VIVDDAQVVHLRATKRLAELGETPGEPLFRSQ
jgi:hypothetical protein